MSKANLQSAAGALRFVCNNHAIQSSLLFHLTIFLSTGDCFFSRLSSFCFLTNDLHLASRCVCVGITSNAVGNSQMGSIFQPNLPQWISMYFIIWAKFAVMHCITNNNKIYYHLLKGFLRSDCFVWIMSVRLICLMVSYLEGFWSFLSCWHAGPADLDASDVHHVLTRPSTSSLLCCAQHQTSAVAAAPPGRHLAAATQQP